MSANKKRAARARKALADFAQARGLDVKTEGIRTVCVDLVTDLLHLIAAEIPREKSFKDMRGSSPVAVVYGILSTSEMHFRAESIHADRK